MDCNFRFLIRDEQNFIGLSVSIATEEAEGIQCAYEQVLPYDDRMQFIYIEGVIRCIITVDLRDEKYCSSSS